MSEYDHVMRRAAAAFGELDRLRNDIDALNVRAGVLKMQHAELDSRLAKVESEDALAKAHNEMAALEQLDALRKLNVPSKGSLEWQ